MNDAPDRNHDEDCDQTVEHHDQTLVLFFAGARQIAYQSPEENDDGDCDDDTDQTVEKTVDHDQH